VRYFIRLNEDPELQAEAKHVEKVSPTEVLVHDVADFPFYTGPIKVSKFELVDESGEVWAFRRLPAAACFVLTDSIRLSVNWRCTVVSGKESIEFGGQG